MNTELTDRQIESIANIEGMDDPAPCCLSFARAIIAAHEAQRQAGQEPDGWKLVPVELDGAMWSVARNEFVRFACHYEDAKTAHLAIALGDKAPGEIYRAILAAAPQPIAQAVQS